VSAKEVFYTTAGTLRAPWRLLLFVLAFIAGTVITQALITPILVFVIRSASAAATAAYFAQGIAALLATWFALRVIDKKPWSDIGLHRAALEPRRLGLALLIGSGAITVAIACLIPLGWLARESGTTDEWTASLVRMGLILIPAALGEELITRGYILTALKDGIGWRWAVTATSVAFGLLHLTNPGANVQSVLVVALAGVFLAVLRIVTDSLYAAWIAHVAWNWVMAAIFHVPVSGFAFAYPDYRYVDAGPDWATGGTWGPEIGLPACLMMIAGIVILNRAAVKDLFLRRRTDG
jgi:membrane protease YdiL (CAAX protease family)